MADSGVDTEGATTVDTARAGHDLLVALAGRLPDRVLWRLRDWLAADAAVALRTALPRTLMRHRTAITDDERDLLREVVTAWRGPARLVDAVLHADVPPESAARFAEAGTGGWDAADLVLRALVPAVGDVGEVRRAWRLDAPAGRGGAAPDRAAVTRVVLISAAGDLAALTGAVQRALRAHGDAAPCVEVIGAGTATTSYHRAALTTSDVLWRAGASVPAPEPDDAPGHPGDGPGPRGAPTPPPELVRHG